MTHRRDAKGAAMKKARVLSTTVAFALLGTITMTGEALAQAYPNRPIKLLVPFTPGGGTDILARIVAGKMAESMGQSVLVENRPGGNTVVATEALVRAAPDGYTLIMQTNNFAANPTLYGAKLSFDTLKDLAPVSLVAGNPHVLVVSAGVPARDLTEYIALACAVSC
jgi:tripartite-type tricarboxylate transporter receptor subunit TctC